MIKMESLALKKVFHFLCIIHNRDKSYSFLTLITFYTKRVILEMIQNNIIRLTQNYFLCFEIVSFLSKVKSPFIPEKQTVQDAIMLTQTIILRLLHQISMKEWETRIEERKGERKKERKSERKKERKKIGRKEGTETEGERNKKKRIEQSKKHKALKMTVLLY